MLKLMDRQLITGYFKSYLVCLTSLLSLWIVVDLFTNLDVFTHHHKTLAGVMEHVASYYGFQLTKIFDLLCEPIVLLAAMFTVAWMQRCNEQFPLLSAGVSTRRIVAPVLLCAALMLTLAVLNQEFLVPQVADRLTYEKDDPGGDKALSIQGQCYEPNGIHIGGDKANRKRQAVTDFECVIPKELAGDMLVIRAREALYVPGQGPRKGGWELTNARPLNLEPIGGGAVPVLERIDEVAGRYFLHTRSVDFDSLTRSPKWYRLASTWRIYDELQRPESGRQAGMAVLFHVRMTRPLLGLVLVVMGLGVILRDQNRNVIISAGMCLVLCAVFFATMYACQMLGEYEVLPAALAAWAPVLLFGPLALVLVDAVHT
jgi:lipopolysaccharide export system permease protein